MNATRSKVLLLRRRLDRVTRGAELLRRKREALVAELFRVARPAIEARAAIATDAQQAYGDLLSALAVHGRDGLEPLGLPERQVPVDVTMRVVWGVEVPDLGDIPPVVRSLALREQAPATPGPAAAEAATAFERLVEHLLESATRELLLERLGDQLARTTRQVNVLEQRLQPRLHAELTAMRRVLEEREREDHLRLRHLTEGGRERAGTSDAFP